MTARKILVLGGTGDIGKEIAMVLKNKFGGIVVAAGSGDIDLASATSIDNFLNANGRDFDIVVHSAGFNKPDLFENLKIAQIENTININLIGFLRLSQELIPHWKRTKNGKVVIISSLYGFISRKGRLAYAISKHALNGAMKTLAIEFAEFGVLVNSVSPGYINTRMTRQNNTSEQISKFESNIPSKRLGDPIDVAEAVAFLVSDQNRYITGHDLIIDGGYSIGGFQG